MDQSGRHVKKLDVKKLDRPTSPSDVAIFRLGPIALSYVRFALTFALQIPWLGIKLDLDVAAESLPARKGEPK